MPVVVLNLSRWRQTETFPSMYRLNNWDTISYVIDRSIKVVGLVLLFTSEQSQVTLR